MRRDSIDLRKKISTVLVEAWSNRKVLTKYQISSGARVRQNSPLLFFNELEKEKALLVEKDVHRGKEGGTKPYHSCILTNFGMMYLYQRGLIADDQLEFLLKKWKRIILKGGWAPGGHLTDMDPFGPGLKVAVKLWPVIEKDLEDVIRIWAEGSQKGWSTIEPTEVRDEVPFLTKVSDEEEQLGFDVKIYRRKVGNPMAAFLALTVFHLLTQDLTQELSRDQIESLSSSERMALFKWIKGLKGEYYMKHFATLNRVFRSIESQIA